MARTFSLSEAPLSAPERSPSRVARMLSRAVVALGASLAGAGSARADEPLTPELTDLRKLTEVAGDRVGYAATEGAFFALSRRFLATGDDASRRALLAEPSPVARAMGLFLRVRTMGKGAVPDLTARLADRGRFDQFPGGCVGWTISVGAFARELLRNRHHLRYGVPKEPLADGAALRRIDLGLLAEDRAANLHDDICVHLGKAVEEGRLFLDWPTLRREGSGLSDVAIAKAVGRVNALDAPRFLLASVADTSLPDSARLAAASALTKFPSDEVVAAVREARAVLDRAAGAPVTERLLATLEARRAHDLRWTLLRGRRTASETEAIIPLVLEAAKEDHPLAVPSLCEALGWWFVRGEVRRAVLDALVRIASRLGPAVPWDAYGDAPFRLEMLSVPVWGRDRHPDPGELQPTECALLAEALRPHLPAK